MRPGRDISWPHVIVGIVVVGMLIGVFVYEKRLSHKRTDKDVSPIATTFNKTTPAIEPPQKHAPAKKAEKSDEKFSENFNLTTQKPPTPNAPAPVTAPIALIKTEDGAIGTPGSDQGSGCAPAEYRGTSLEKTKVDSKEWSRVMDVFHGIKADYYGWLKDRKSQLSPTIFSNMDRIMHELKIQRAPVPEHPDLAWRGIGIFSNEAGTEPIIRLGGGFMYLLQSSPARARFELARLVAQVWSPCELSRFNAQETWNALLTCLDMKEPNACISGSFSEGAWAVSSALASVVAPPPGCLLPAFKNEKNMACLNSLRPKMKKTQEKKQ